MQQTVIRVDEASLKELGFTDVGGSQQVTEEQLLALLEKITEIQKKRAYSVTAAPPSPFTLFKTTTVPGMPNNLQFLNFARWQLCQYDQGACRPW